MIGAELRKLPIERIVDDMDLALPDRQDTLRAFWEKHSDAEGALRAWFDEVEAADWKGPQDIRERYGSADFLANDRVIFDIRGNNYRLVVHVAYRFHAVYIRFIGTHAEYDKVDAATV